MKRLPVLLLVPATVFLAEAAVMLGLSAAPPLSAWAASLVDGLLLAGMMIPLVLWTWVRPMRRELASKASTLEQLQALRDTLERRVAERTAALSAEVAERARAQEELRVAKEFFESLVASSAVASFVIDASHRVLFWNRACEALTGVAAARVVGTGDHWTAFYPERRPCLADAVLEGGAPDAGQYRVLDQSPLNAEALRGERWFTDAAGRTRYIGFDAAPLKDGRGRVVGAIETLQDLTHRKRAEDALQEAHSRLEAVFQASPLPMFSVDPDGRVLFWNPAAEWTFGWTEEEAMGHFLPIVPSDKVEEFRALRTEVFAGRGFTGFEARRQRKDGSPVDLSVSTAPLRDSDGNIVGALSVVEDITERKQLQDQLRQAQKMEAVGRLAGGVAHDFNNLLTIILGMSELARDDAAPGSQLLQQLEQILGAGQRAAGLTRQLLAFSRQQVFQVVTVDVNALVQNLAKMLRRLIGEDIELTVEPAQALWPVAADPGQVEQVLMNLAVNARDAMLRGGRLTVRTANVEVGPERRRPGLEPGSYATFAVSDTGTGMEPQILARIFEPFFTTKGPEQGTGLGLATVYGIVKQSHGYVDVESAPGLGSTFTVYLPRAEPRSATACAANGAAPGGVERILVVEDEEPVRGVIVSALRRSGYRVLEATGAEEACRLVAGDPDPVHLLITDVVMPGVAGPELGAKLQALHPTLRVLYISGYPGSDLGTRCVLEPSAHFLAKPFAQEALRAKVRDVLDGRGT
ncbi:MAG: PAS domain S-box protein [Deltaproteobacteria bacterium]|nr:PAS domain S-box protein [Deltaproteobacteria bacterium]